jgi:hypothetical protein
MEGPKVRPICFMVMPFGKKLVEPRAERAPERVDFDSLWNKAIAPTLEELGYEPIRADQETGASIILEMLERLYFSDLVVADMTLPNGNVYYEVGVRHACKRVGCVLTSADWSRPLFDVNQMRRVVYPLPEGLITDESAEAIRSVLRDGIKAPADGTSPLFQHIPGFPDSTKIDLDRASAIRQQLDALSAFQARVREAKLARDPAQCRNLALALRDAYPANGTLPQIVALEVTALLRDCAGWQTSMEYIDKLPAAMRELDILQEQRCLAQSNTGDHLAAIAALEELIRRRGESSERHGLIGGRYKKLAHEAKRKGDQPAYRDHLDRSIRYYEHGMRLDLNDYYPTSNLPRLYRERGEDGDIERASTAANIALFACERARLRKVSDDWINPTLLGLAFDAADLPSAQRYVKEVRRDGPAAWKLETTIADLQRSVEQTQDIAKRETLANLLAELRGLVRA